MKLLLTVEHPAWVHQFKYIIKELVDAGHDVKILAIRKDVTIDLLDAYSIPFEIISDSSGNNLFEKGLIFIVTTWKIFNISRKYSPDIYFGRSSPMMAINAFLFHKPHVIFEDSEPSKFSLKICKLCSDVIITPNTFKLDLGRKQLSTNGFKELFYLHPDLFVPKLENILKYDLQPWNYIVIRFVSWTAHHDIGQHGITKKSELIHVLSKKCNVVIISEGKLPNELEKYQMSAPPDAFHDILAYAKLLISDSQTVTIEAAMLGVPAIRYNTWVGPNDLGGFDELEEKYGLIYNLTNENNILPIANNLLNCVNLHEKWLIKRNRMLDDKINMTNFFLKIMYETMRINQDTNRK